MVRLERVLKAKLQQTVLAGDPKRFFRISRRTELAYQEGFDCTFPSHGDLEYLEVFVNGFALRLNYAFRSSYRLPDEIESARVGVSDGSQWLQVGWTAQRAAENRLRGKRASRREIAAG